MSRATISRWQGLDLPPTVLDAAEGIDDQVVPAWRRIDRMVEAHTLRMIEAFREEGIGEGHFAGTTGYGFHDAGREALDRVTARVLGAPAALVRWQFVSGTHAVACLLRAALPPGKTLICVTGPPYDTLIPVLEEGFAARGNPWRQVPLGTDGRPDGAAILAALTPDAGAVFVQRSRGYDWRPSLPVAEIASLCNAIHAARPELPVVVDNCYGELVEESEPAALGADAMAGSLIKNLGGGLAPTGGYVAGRRDLVEAAAAWLTAPGVGADEGATLGMNRLLFQGLFLAPHTVGQALRGAVWAAALFEALGLETDPGWDAPRTDLIQGVRLGSPDALQAFCQGIQSAGPIDARATLQPVRNPGYRDPIIMAGGSFVQGSSMELSADGPLRPPFAAYLQGGLTTAHVKVGVLLAAAALERGGWLP